MTPKNFQAFKVKLQADHEWAQNTKKFFKEQKIRIKELEIRNKELENLLAKHIPDTDDVVFQNMRNINDDSSEDETPAVEAQKRKVKPN